jgi:hypothetical protein
MIVAHLWLLVGKQFDDANVDELLADTAAVALAGSIAGDAVADLVEATELFDIDMDHLTGMLALKGRTGSAGSRSRIRFNPNRRRMRLTIAGETPTSAAICSPV